MKLKLMVVAALVACSAVAMPTDDELEKATKEVQAALESQIAAYQSGSISDGDLAALMLMKAAKYNDEARRYACLQAAFALIEELFHFAEVAESLIYRSVSRFLAGYSQKCLRISHCQ